MALHASVVGVSYSLLFSSEVGASARTRTVPTHASLRRPSMCSEHVHAREPIAMRNSSTSYAREYPYYWTIPNTRLTPTTTTTTAPLELDLATGCSIPPTCTPLATQLGLDTSTYSVSCTVRNWANSVCTVSCIYGISSGTPAVYTCPSTGGLFSPTTGGTPALPICNPPACSAAPTLALDKFAVSCPNGWTVGSSCTATCRVGVGSATYTCKAGNPPTWGTVSPPTCLPACPMAYTLPAGYSSNCSNIVSGGTCQVW